MEGQLALDGEWGLLGEVFPELRWELVLVGPEMQELGSRDGAGGGSIAADAGEGRVRARGVRLKGHDWARQAPQPPDFAVLFNSGIGTLALTLVRHWLATVEALLSLSVPVLFTCFSEKERRGEEYVLRQLFKARVLVDFLENPLRPELEDTPVGYTTRAGHGTQNVDSMDKIERDDDRRICNTHVWWACGSELPPAELSKVCTVV